MCFVFSTKLTTVMVSICRVQRIAFDSKDDQVHIYIYIYIYTVFVWEREIIIKVLNLL